jgi:hypothetical protein
MLGVTLLPSQLRSTDSSTMRMDTGRRFTPGYFCASAGSEKNFPSLPEAVWKLWRVEANACFIEGSPSIQKPSPLHSASPPLTRLSDKDHAASHRVQKPAEAGLGAGPAHVRPVQQVNYTFSATSAYSAISLKFM